MIEIRDDGRIVCDGMVVGKVSEEEWPAKGGGFTMAPTISLQLGWCKEAGVHVRVLGDPAVDRQRDGKVLER